MTFQHRTPDGKRLRSTSEWLRVQGDDEVVKFRIYNETENRVLEGWKNVRTGARTLTGLRRPTDVEEREFKTKVKRSDIELCNARATKEMIDKRIRGRK